jgi:uncharacterized membrane protein
VKMKVKVTGMASARMMLRSVGEKVPDTARKQMHRSAARIVKRAQLYVPEDEGNLKNSIRIEKSYGVRGRLQIDVVAGDTTVFNAAGKEIDLNQYAWIIHENYSAMNPGEKTQAKRAANPEAYIGEKFLERASEEERVALERNLVDAITKIIKGATKK